MIPSGPLVKGPRLWYTRSMTEEKTKVSFEDIMASLDKDTKSKVRAGSEISNEVIPTVSISLNRLIGGGFHKGKQHTLWGSEQSCKTGFMMQTAAQAQQSGEVVAWIDAEHTFDPAWAIKLGLDPSRLILSQVSTISETTDLQVKLIKAGAGLIVIDSTSALMPRAIIKDGEMKAFDDTMQLGQMAKEQGQMCKMVQGINYSCAIVNISQVRNKFGSMHVSEIPTGGKAVEHTDALRIKMFSSQGKDKALTADVKRGNNIVQEKVGIPVTWTINKNKLNGRYGNGDFDFYVSGDNIGFDLFSETVDMAIGYGFIEQKGAWFTMHDGERKQGRHNVVAYLRENPEAFAEIKDKVLAEPL